MNWTAAAGCARGAAARAAATRALTAEVRLQILRDLGLRKLRILTNNPKKIYGIDGFGLCVVDQVPLKIEPGEYNKAYLATKKEKMGHTL